MADGRTENYGLLAVLSGSLAFALLILTSVHHAYGAIVYNTPWRLDVVKFAAAAAILIVGSLYLGAVRLRGFTSRLALWLGVAAIFIFPVAGIGLFEGGYNHVVKNIVFFTLGSAAELRMFPPPLYEQPGDAFFEISGIAQFPLAIALAVCAIKLLRRSSRVR